MEHTESSSRSPEEQMYAEPSAAKAQSPAERVRLVFDLSLFHLDHPHELIRVERLSRDLSAMSRTHPRWRELVVRQFGREEEMKTRSSESLPWKLVYRNTELRARELLKKSYECNDFGAIFWSFASRAVVAFLIGFQRLTWRLVK